MATPAAGTAQKKRNERMLSRAENATTKNPNITFTPEALARLQQLEDEARIEAGSNPNLELGFAAVTDFLQQWAALNPEQQAQLGQQFQERANALVDIPFDQELSDLRGGLSRQLQALNQKYDFLSENETQKLEQGIQDLDKDAVEQLTNAFISIEERGLGNSGSIRTIANAIMNDKKSVIARAQEIMQTNLRQGQEIRDLAATDAQANLAAQERTTEQERTVAREEKKGELVSRATQTDLLQQIMAGNTELSPRDLATYKPETLNQTTTPTTTPNPTTLNPDTLPTPESIPTTATPNISPAQRIRDLRLGISGNTVQQRMQTRFNRRSQ